MAVKKVVIPTSFKEMFATYTKAQMARPDISNPPSEIAFVCQRDIAQMMGQKTSQLVNGYGWRICVFQNSLLQECFGRFDEVWEKLD